MDSEYKILGFVSLLILAAGLMVVPIKWPRGRHYSFSQHVAMSKSAIIYYAILFAVSLPLFNLFVIKWFAPMYQLTYLFVVIIVTASIAQIACTLVPETGGRHTSIHRILVGISGLLLIPALAIMLTSPYIDIFGKIFTAASLIAMLSVVAIVSLQLRSPRNWLVLQVVYYTAFFMPIMLVAYTQ